ncbi:MAG: preprotein translocase subunit SecE [Clostridia bacterium]|nr:preprotein translocase subunit SecE [Clostridia bacterium]
MAEATAKNKKSAGRITKYFKEVKSEMKKVVWPSKKQVIKNTLIVIAAVVLIGVVIWALDLLFSFGLNTFIK